MSSLNRIIACAEQTISEAGHEVQAVFILQCGDRITIRDNSGIVGLTDAALLEDALTLLIRLYPEQFKKQKS